jgi:hypothetical protein
MPTLCSVVIGVPARPDMCALDSIGELLASIITEINGRGQIPET